jgi:hypothetical protein
LLDALCMSLKHPPTCLRVPQHLGFAATPAATASHSTRCNEVKRVSNHVAVNTANLPSSATVTAVARKALITALGHQAVTSLPDQAPVTTEPAPAAAAPAHPGQSLRQPSTAARRQHPLASAKHSAWPYVVHAQMRPCPSQWSWGCLPNPPVPLDGTGPR